MPLQVRFSLLALLILALSVGFALGTWFTGSFFGGYSANQFIVGCNAVHGVGNWNVTNLTCTALDTIPYVEFPNTPIIGINP